MRPGVSAWGWLGVNRSILVAVALGAVCGPQSAAAAQPPAAPFDLVSQQRDANGLMLNPSWAITTPPAEADPAKRCGILGMRGTPGYRPVLLRDPTCFSPAQLEILRLNEPVRDVVGGIACGQAFDDGSPHGHLNWVPVTMEGTILFTKKTKNGGDRDLTFEFIGDERAPATKWNGDRKLWARLDSTDGPVHLEFDYRETTDRLPPTASPSWWLDFARAADEPEQADAFLGLGRAVVTGMFNLDLVHFGHSEIHPVYGLAVLVDIRSPSPTVQEHHWVFMARDRGNQGNCARPGALPFRLGDRSDLTDTFRIRLGAPDGADAAPEIVRDDSWVGTTGATVTGPDFSWSRTEGLQLEVGWPRPTQETTGDALLLGEIVVRWTGDFAAAPRGPWARGLERARRYRALDRTLAEPAYYDEVEVSDEPAAEDVPRAFAATTAARYAAMDRIRESATWSSTVRTVSTLPAAPDVDLIPAEVFEWDPPVRTCADVKRSENPRCFGNWSITPVAGLGAREILDSRSNRHLSFDLGVENVRHYLGGPFLRVRFQAGYLWRSTPDSAGIQRHEHAVTAESAFILGPARLLGGVYGVVSPGVGLSHLNGGWGGLVQARAGGGIRVRSGYRVGVYLEVLRTWRSRGPHYWSFSLRVPIAAF